MAAMNRKLYPEVETVFLMPDDRFIYLSSSIVKEAPVSAPASTTSFRPPRAGDCARNSRLKPKPR